MIFGADYARLINSSVFVPTCGTIANEVVRKHFEIPGCRTCLVTEKTPGLVAAGFSDMENCVFADEHDVLDKINHLFSNPDIIQSIADQGHSLVHGPIMAGSRSDCPMVRAKSSAPVRRADRSAWPVRIL